MKTKYLIVVVSFLVYTVAVSFGSDPPNIARDGEGQKIQHPAWDATLSQLITSTASQVIDISGRIWYEFFPSADCKGRLMNDTTKATWPAFTLKANTAFRGANDATATKYRTKFLNLSGCTGDYRAQ